MVVVSFLLGVRDCGFVVSDNTCWVIWCLCVDVMCVFAFGELVVVLFVLCCVCVVILCLYSCCHRVVVRFAPLLFLRSESLMWLSYLQGGCVMCFRFFVYCVCLIVGGVGRDE